MAGKVSTIAFAVRQAGVPVCGVVNLKFPAGDVRAEYLSGSEINTGSAWEYQFLVQEEDLVGSMTLDEVLGSNLIEPYWSCLVDDLEEEAEDECEARNVRCFDGPDVITALGEGDYVAILRHNDECDTYCLGIMDPYQFTAQSIENAPE